MFKLQDFWDIFDYLKDDSATSLLDENLKVKAQSEKTKATSLFENTLDQVCFASDDYKRLREMLIDWYASLKTMGNTGATASDPFSLPNDHLDELCRSFGYHYAGDIASFTSKVQFFLDLVNLYKIKGTPLALLRVLDYYWITDTDLSEFYLERSADTGLLHFRSERVNTVSPGEIDIAIPDIDFDTMTYNDPHWHLSYSECENLIAANKINTPSKSPYYGIRPRYSLHQLDASLSYLQKQIQDQYDTWDTHGTLPSETILVGYLNYSMTLIELYLSCVYLYIEYYSRHSGSSDLNFVCYDGTASTATQVLDEFEALNVRPTTRADQKALIETAFDLFSKPMTTNFLQAWTTAGTVLSSMNPSLKAVLDSIIGVGNGLTALQYLLRDLTSWMKTNIKQEIPDLAVIMLGLETFPFLNNVLNFFKPYHARLATVNLAFVNDAKLLESLVIEDLGITMPYLHPIDFLTCNSVPCCDGTTCTLYSRETYDCGSHYDLGAACDVVTPPSINVNEINSDILNATTDSTAITVQNIEIDTTASAYSIADVVYAQCGGWNDYDEGSYFDSQFANDVCQVYVYGGAGPWIGYSPPSFTTNVEIGHDAPDDTLYITNLGLSTLDYEVSTDATAWLHVYPNVGESTGETDSITLDYLSTPLSVGAYNGTVTITSSVAGNSPVDIPVTLNVVTIPIIELSTSTISETSGYGWDATSAFFSVRNIGTGTLNYTISDDRNWMNCVPASGDSTSEWDLITVEFDTDHLGLGANTGTITVSDPNASNTPQTIDVSFNYVRSEIELSTSTINVTSGFGHDATTAYFTVRSDSIGILEYTITDDVGWLTCVPDTGASGGEYDTIAVEFDTDALSSGLHTAVITVTDINASNSPQTIDVNLTVNAPVIELSTDSITLSCEQGTDCTSTTFAVRSASPGVLNYTITDNTAWLECVPSSGDSTGEWDIITVNYSTSGLSDGTHTAVITVSDPNASNNPQTIDVFLSVIESAPPVIATDTTGIYGITPFGIDATSEYFHIWNSGTGSMPYNITADAPIIANRSRFGEDSSSWITIIPSSGESTGESDTIEVAFSTTDLIVATHTATITIDSGVAANSPLVLPVTMVVDGTATVEASQVMAEVEANIEEKIAVSQVQLDVEFVEGDEIRMTQNVLDVEMTEKTGVKLAQAGIHVEGVIGDQMQISQLYIQAEVE